MNRAGETASGAQSHRGRREERREVFHLTKDICSLVQVRVHGLFLDLLAGDWEEDPLGTSMTIKRELALSSMRDSAPACVYVRLWLQDAYGVVGLPQETRCVESGTLCEDDLGKLWCAWGDLLTFPVKVQDLQRSSRLYVAAMYSLNDRPGFCVLGGSVLPLFYDGGRLRTGNERMALWAGMEPDNTGISTPHAYTKDQVRILAGYDASDDIEKLFRLQEAWKRFESGHLESVPWLDSLSCDSASRAIRELKTRHGLARGLELQIELPRYDFDVFYSDSGVHVAAPQAATSAAHATSLQQICRHGLETSDAYVQTGHLVTFIDSEVGKDSPAEGMAQKMSRSAGRENENVLLRPNTQERAMLDRIATFPPTKELRQNEKNLIWRYRYSLTNDRRALTKFLTCVDWADAAEAQQAVKLMSDWATIDVGDALEMLSPSFKVDVIRKHAVAFLRTVPDNELLVITLQLVQALRYESYDESDLFSFLLEKSLKNRQISSSVFWHLCSELEDEAFGSRAQVLQTALLRSLDDDSMLKEDASIPLQLNLIARLRHLHESIKAYRSAEARTEHLRALLLPGGSCEDLTAFSCPNPLDPLVMLRGIMPAKCLVFQSKVKPMRLSWRTVESDHHGEHAEVSFIYKRGDDLRQDQLIMQIFTLMDNLLKREHLDLQITTYNILPTSLDDGLIEFVPEAKALSHVLQSHGSILDFLKEGNQRSHTYNYIRSCAGYTVFTYVLGIGDRHQDNIMITKEGRLFHIDFGYILGADPKFKQAPLVLTRAMVDAMGDDYPQFVELACECFTILRKSANLLLSVIHVMARSSIPDIRADHEMAMLKVQQKLLLDLPDDAACGALEALIDAAQRAVLPKLAEIQHSMARTFNL
jgi:phosphatidylinositol 3-kinase